MKETVNVNLASQAFTFDKDAYRSMKVYLAAIRRRLPKEDEETLNDVEARLAEILRAKLSSPMMVVTFAMVQEAKSQMGDPSEFGDGAASNVENRNGVDTGESEEVPSRRLYRSRSDRSIAGVCGGLAEYLEVDVAAGDTAIDSLRRRVDLGLCYFVDSDPVGTGRQDVCKK